MTIEYKPEARERLKLFQAIVDLSIKDADDVSGEAKFGPDSGLHVVSVTLADSTGVYVLSEDTNTSVITEEIDVTPASTGAAPVTVF